MRDGEPSVADRRRRARRRVTGLAAGVALLALAATATGAGAAIRAQDTDTTLSYTCQFPSGPVHIGVDLAVTLPQSSSAGGSIQPTDLTATFDVPTALPDFTQVDTASVSLQAQLSVAVTQGDSTSSVSWPGLAAPTTPLPATGDLSLAAVDAVPAIPVGPTGNVSVAVGPLTVVLTTLTADGHATVPATLPLICTLDPNQNAVLATVSLPSVPVTGTSGGTSGVGSGGGRGPTLPGGRAPVANTGGTPGRGGPTTGGGVHSNATAPPVYALIRGYSNVQKLHGAVALGPGKITLTNTGIATVGGVIHIYYTGLLDLPPAQGTFLAFDFVPNTSMMEFDQVGLFDIDAYAGTAVITGQENIRIYDATINGVKLDVGDRCMTSKPIDLTLTGEPGKHAYNPVAGGYADGTFTIPPFANCGTTENLDPLLTGLVSGPDNFMRMEQSKTCPVSSTTCKPTYPD
jgi:hypothetical protein